jgi:hypothetical protein
MTATNHGLMGIVIGAYMPLPYAIPVAFVSHFILDALPHYGIPQKQRNRSKIYKRVVTVDTIAALLLAVMGAAFGDIKITLILNLRIFFLNSIKIFNITNDHGEHMSSLDCSLFYYH